MLQQLRLRPVPPARVAPLPLAVQAPKAIAASEMVNRSLWRHQWRKEFYAILWFRNIVVRALPTVVALVCLQGLDPGARLQGGGGPVLRAAA